MCFLNMTLAILGVSFCCYICSTACTLSQKHTTPLHPAEHYCHLQRRGNLDRALIFSFFYTSPNHIPFKDVI